MLFRSDFSHLSVVVDFDVEGIVPVELFVMSERWQPAEQQAEQQA